jgi:hypothetical protein
MKLSKAVYNQTDRVYQCDIKDAESFRFKSDCEGTPLVYTPSVDAFFKESVEACTHDLYGLTKGWFTTPLKEEWLLSHLRYNIPTEMIPSDFQGTVTFDPARLSISKEGFVIYFELTDMKECENVGIDIFKEDELSPAEAVQADSALQPMQHYTASQPMQPHPASHPCPASQPQEESTEKTRRVKRKEDVLKARERAARALFKAEQLIHAYVQDYGDLTEWEDEQDEENESSQ